MRTKIILSTIACIVLLLNSCDKVEFGNEFLDKEPSGGDVTKDTIFNSLLLTKRYLTTGYTTLPYGLPTTQSGKGNKVGNDLLESFTDLNNSYLRFGSMVKYYYSGFYGSAVEVDFPFDTKYSFTKEGSWDGIRIGWNIIENADRIPDATPEEIKQLKGEAKMIIAVHYCDMYRHYGGLPWIDKVYSVEGAPSLPRQTALETMNKIEALINEAIEDLPWVIANKNDDGRFTKASAMGLKARLLLFGASPLFNDGEPYLGGEASNKFYTWHGGKDANLWKRAADAAKELLDGIDAFGGYALVQTGNPRQDFQDAYYKRGNGEVLISTRVRFNGTSYWPENGGYYFYASAGQYGTACPTKEYVDMFPMANGLPITDPDSGWNPNFPWANRDPRLYETVLVNGDQFQGRTAELYPGGRETRPGNGDLLLRTGFKLRKFLLDTDNLFSSVQGKPVHWPYLRLAEIYLSYAEALNEVNGGPTPEAYEAVNKVRNRVGLGNLKTDLDVNGFREAVITERALEFGYEEVRWYDITRRKMADKFTNRLHGNIIENTTNPAVPFSYKTTLLIPQRAWSADFSPKWYLSAFPSTEVNKGYGLTQNPGW